MEKKMQILLSLMFVLILVIGAGLYSLLPEQGVSSDKPSYKAIRETNFEDVGSMYELDTFVLNLQDEAGARYLKASITLELSDEELKNEVNIKLPLVRDLIISNLTYKSYDEVSTNKGMEKVKDEIFKDLNNGLVGGQVKNIYFTDFVIQ